MVWNKTAQLQKPYKQQSYIKYQQYSFVSYIRMSKQNCSI